MIAKKHATILAKNEKLMNNETIAPKDMKFAKYHGPSYNSSSFSTAVWAGAGVGEERLDCRSLLWLSLRRGCDVTRTFGIGVGDCSRSKIPALEDNRDLERSAGAVLRPPKSDALETEENG